jgi:hypothetical protein
MTVQIPANDHGAIYVFEVIGKPPADLGDKTDTAMMAVFGPVVLNTDYVDVITPGVLADMTLPQFIKHGYDMPVAGGVAEELRSLIGTAVLVMSAAFGGQEAALDLPENTRLVTVLREKSAINVIEPLTATSAEGTLDTKPAKPPKSNARMSGMVATYALLAMFALVGLMIWVGG